MNTFFQKPGMTRFHLLFDNQNEKKGLLLSEPTSVDQVKIMDGRVYVDDVLQNTVHIDHSLYWEDREGRCWTMEAGDLMRPCRGIVKQNGSIQRFTALPSTSYMLCHDAISAEGKKFEVDFRLEYGLTPTEEGGFFSYCRFWYQSEDCEKLAATNLEADKAIDPSVYCESGITIHVEASGTLFIRADLSSTISLIQIIYPDKFPGFATYYDLHTTSGFDEIVGTARDDYGNEMEVKKMAKKDNLNMLGSFSQDDRQVLKNHFMQSEMPSLLKSDEPPMSVTDLFSLNIPDSVKLNDDFSSLFSSVMLYFSFDKSYHYKPSNKDITYANWFGLSEQNPQLKRIAGILGLSEDKTKQYLEELKKKNNLMEIVDAFAKVNLCNSFAASGEEKILNAFQLGQLPDSEDKPTAISYKCNYYFNGYYRKNDHQLDSFQANADITGLQNQLMNELYLSRVDGLRRYVDSEDRASWAKKLFEHCKKNKSNIAMVTYSAGGNKGYLKHLCTMLDLLDNTPCISFGTKGEDGKEEKVSYGSALYLYILNFSTAQLADSFVVTDDNVGDCRTYLEEFFSQLTDIYFHDAEKLAPDVVKQIDQIAKEYKLYTAEEMKTAYELHMEELVSIFVEGFSKNPITTGLAKHPFAKSFFGELGVLAMYGMIFYMLMPVFTDWKKASKEERAFAVISTLRIVVGVGCDLVRLAAIKTLSNPASELQDVINAVQRLKFGGDDIHIIKDIYTSKNPSRDCSLIDSLKDTARYRVKNPETVNLTTKCFTMANMLLRGINVAIMGFTVYELARKIIQDIAHDEGAAVITMDILQEVCFGANALCEGISLVLDCFGLACEVIPVVGVFFMLGGVLLSMLANLIAKPKEKDSPEVAFTKDVLSSFVAMLPHPDQKWIDHYNKGKNNQLSASLSPVDGCGIGLA